MGLAVTDIQSSLLNKQYPAEYLDINTVQGVCDDALRELNVFTPKIGFVSFASVDDKQDYYIYDTTKTEGLCPNGLGVLDVWFNPAGDFSSPDIFSPGFQLFTTIVVYGTNTFDYPSDMTVLRQKLNAWETQFGAQGFKEFGQPGDPSAFIRLSPVPQSDDSTIVVAYYMPFEISDILSLSLGWGRYFLQWAEVYAAEAVANAYAATAGTTVAGFRDDGKTLAYWTRKAQEKRRFAESVQGGIHAGVVLRS